jgi:hypothetical protein
MNGVELIAAERQRQIDVEGWTPEHDDKHTVGELSENGACYARHASKQVCGIATDHIPTLWIWEAKWWKPSPDPIRNLVKAGALIAAEIDRLQRAKDK